MQKRKKLWKNLAFLLCAVILMSDSGLVNLMAAENSVNEAEEVIEDNDNSIADTQAETSTDPAVASDVAETVEAEPRQQPFVYWNPQQEAETQDGNSEQTAFADLQSAIARGAELEELLNTGITIYVMNPLSIGAGQELTIDARGMQLECWQHNNAAEGWLFRLSGGSVTLTNAGLSSKTAAKSAVIAITGGSLTIGQKVTIDDNILLDYSAELSQQSLPPLQLTGDLSEIETYTLDLRANAAMTKAKAVQAAGEAAEALEHFTLTADASGQNWQLQADQENLNYLNIVKNEIPTATESAAKRSLSRAAETVVYWNINATATSPEGDRPAIKGGSDSNAGNSEDYPVLTWQRVKEILGGAGGTVILMNPIVIGDTGFSEAGVPITSLDGEAKITLRQWDGYPSEMFLIPPGSEFTLKNIRVEGISGTIIRITNEYNMSAQQLGKLIIEDSVYLTGGFIQGELDPNAPEQLAEPIIELKTTDVTDRIYNVYFSGIDDNQEFQYADVIKVPDGADANDYLSIFVLHTKNQTAGWALRKDSYEDDSPVVDNHIELYRQFVYSGIYLNGQSGDDEWFGGNCNWPVRTFARAKELLIEYWDDIEASDRIIYICDTVDITTAEAWDLSGLTGAVVVNCTVFTGYTGHHDEVPTTLVSVKEGGIWTTSDITIQYINRIDNTMIEVLPGGSYTLNEGTTISGAGNYYGTGVTVTGAAGKDTALVMNGGMITGKNTGVAVNTGAVFTMSGGAVTDNSTVNSYSEGAGVRITEAVFTMSSGTISENVAMISNFAGHGGGVYITGATSVFTMSGGTITGNKAVPGSTGATTTNNVSQGGGIYLENGTFNFEAGEISKNAVENRYYSQGGGVFIDHDGTMLMSGGTISENTYTANMAVNTTSGGGGIFCNGILNLSGGVIEKNRNINGGGIMLANSGCRFTMTGGNIRDNAASYYGGGIFNSANVATEYQPVLSGGSIETNTAATNGAGINSSYIMTITGTVAITKNKVTSDGRGGGIYSSGTLYVTGGSISENEACYGAGLYLMGSTYLQNGTITGNTAVSVSGSVPSQGGGIYNNGTLFQQGTAVVDNRADLGGSIYSIRTTYLLSGELSAAAGENDDSKYGIYLNVPTTVNYRNCIDAEKITLTDRIYLNTATSKLYLLDALELPLTVAKLPINVNREQFDVGSVVVTAAKITLINIGGTTYTYPDFTDVSLYADYFSGGEIPPKTRLGGFNQNIILVGEGVYLDGNNGNDTTNSGTSPADAVKTFARANAILAEQIAAAKANAQADGAAYNPEGFEPFIYICGQVDIVAGAQDESWTLDYDAADFNQRETLNKEGAIINTNLAQIKRFASYYGIMVNIPFDGSLTMGKLIIDGNAGGVDGASDTVSSMIFIRGGDLILENTVVQNNYSSGIYNTGGTVLMKGSDSGDGSDGAQLSAFGAYAVGLASGGTMVMQDHSEIYNPRYIDNDIENGEQPGIKTEYGAAYIQGDSSKLTMNDTATAASPGRMAIVVVGRNTVSTTPMFEMNDQTSVKDSLRGITLNGKNSVALMQDEAVLQNNSVAVYIYATNSQSAFTAAGNTSIIGSDAAGGNTRTSNGIHIYANSNASSASASNKNAIVNLEGNSTITDTNYGIYLQAINHYVQINLKDAAIENSNYGVYTFSFACLSAGDGTATTELNLSGNARIGGRAESLYNNINAGVYLDSRLKIQLQDDARISYNGEQGICAKPRGNYNHPGTGNGTDIHLEGNSSVGNNGGNGIYSQEFNLANVPNTLNHVNIILEGNASIADNGGEGIILCKGGTLTLKDNVTISGNTAAEAGAAVNALGKINMDGTVNVDQEIYVTEAGNPITLTTAAVNDYLIGCSDNFIGQNLIIPDGTNLSTVDEYIDAFSATNNFPAGKAILARTPNLIVEGENNVYLAGPHQGGLLLAPGDDANNGGGPGAPVATFARALEILKSLSPGANIIICNYPITITEDQVWQFDSGGSVTNSASSETWIPKVLRYREYTGNMITLAAAFSLTLQDIILDGNKAEIPEAGAASAVYLNNQDAVLNIEAGAILQNSRCSATQGAAVNVLQGTVNINGGSIESNEAVYASAKNFSGGAIYSSGTVNMTAGSIKNNRIECQLGTIYYGGSGGGIYSRGILNISGGTISGNQIVGALARGSAIYILNGTAVISGAVTITDNLVNGAGYVNSVSQGTIYISSGTVTLGNVEIANNEVVNSYSGSGYSSYAAQGGGLAIYGGTAKIAGANIHHNICRSEGAAEATAAQLGGGIFVVGTNAAVEFLSGRISDNRAKRGAGIYYNGGSFILGGGVIQDNTPIQPEIAARGFYAGIFVAANNFNLKGGGAEINDYIFLATAVNPLILGGAIYQRSRLYHLDLDSGYKKGSVVVKPDNEVILDTTSYLRYFTTEIQGFVLEKESPNLILKQCIYIDSQNGADTRNGANPDLAVKTMARAQAIGGAAGNYIVYASGPIYVDSSTGTNQSWTFPNNAWISRYTGFPITGYETSWPAYTEPLVTVRDNASLTLQSVAIYGRRSIDAEIMADSLLRVETGATVTLNAGTHLTLNSNGIGKPGGAINIDGGTVNLNGGTISQTTAATGSAIYQAGSLNLNNESAVSGAVYLTGQGNDEADSHYINATPGYMPQSATKLSVNIENPYDGRRVVSYPAGITPGEEQKGYYELNVSITAIYQLANRSEATNILELQQKGVVYINGIAGQGADTNNGRTPADAVATLKRAYEILAEDSEGGVIMVVGQVTVNDTINLKNVDSNGIHHGYYSDAAGGDVDALGAVYIMRYGQPTDWESFADRDKYDIASYTGVLLEVAASGILTVENINVDGHSNEIIGNPLYASAGVAAAAAMVQVKGKLAANGGSVFSHNNNVTVDAKGSAIFIDGGTVDSIDITISDVSAPNGKGSAVYQDGTFYLNRNPDIQGEVHLTGDGTEAGSKYIEIVLNGFILIQGKLEITMDNPYLGRPVVKYPSESTPTAAEIELFRMERSVTDSYSLGSRIGAADMLELQYRRRVYIDGVNGLDSNTGDTPAAAVKTLQKAYGLLKVLGGGYLYVVNTVTVEQNMSIDEVNYNENGNPIDILSGTVEIRRYVVPDAKAADAAFSGPGTHLGTLFEVASGITFNISNIIVDGHKDAVDSGDEFQDVAAATRSQAPLILVKAGGVLNLNENAVLQNNDNILTAGGAINNQGTLNFDGAKLTGNQADKGAGIYQDGYFTILYGAAFLAQQEIYLTSTNTGTATAPIWGSNQVIHVQEDFPATVRLDVDADNPVKGRQIAVYDFEDIYDTTVDNEYFHYNLGTAITAVTPRLYLVASTTAKDTLELNNYEILEVSVPAEIFLVMVENPTVVIAGNTSARNEQLQAPNYTITNNGAYKAQISLVGFENHNSDVPVIGWDDMILVDTPGDLTGADLNRKLYLGITTPDTAADNGFGSLTTTALAAVDSTTPLVLGTLEPESSGRFTFVGSADSTFFAKYQDLTFRSDAADVKAYIRDNARAKYQMIYKFELVR